VAGASPRGNTALLAFSCFFTRLHHEKNACVNISSDCQQASNAACNAAMRAPDSKQSR
jgi:hypothetical protein